MKRANIAIADAILSAASAARWVAGGWKEGWQSLLGSGSVRVAKSAAAARMDSSAMKTTVSVAPLSLHPAALGISAGKSIVKGADSVVNDRLGALAARQTLLTEQAGLLSQQYRSLGASLAFVETQWADRMSPAATPQATGAVARAVDAHMLRSRRLPAGVSTEELAQSFIDQGGWPVITVFALGYPTADAPPAQ